MENRLKSAINKTLPREGNDFNSPLGKGVITGYGSPKSAEGLDVFMKKHEIFALKDGVVLSVGEEGGWGNRLRVRYDDGVEVRYGHLANLPDIKVGQRFRRGDGIAIQGNTGNVMTQDKKSEKWRDVNSKEREDGYGEHVDIAIPGFSPKQIAQYLGIKKA